ncbi:MAG: FIST C-terminal domain-containing protein [Bacteroidetes bacterium]|nr:FIST C-terminal domain-containing protein [Bacteroidota bacterium]
MVVKSFHTDSVKGFRQAWADQTAGGFNPNAVVVFSSVELDLQEIVSFLQPRNVSVFGCSSCGEFLYDEHNQVITEGGLVCLMMALIPGTFEIRLFSGKDQSSFDLGNKVGKWAGDVFEKPAILILGSGLDTDGEQLVRGIQHVAGNDITMFGGLAGDDARFKETFVFSGDKLENNGAIAMAFDTKNYEIHGIATSGWVSIGADKIITHSEGNVVYTIDGQPALDVYKSYLNVRDTDLPEIGVEYPLLIKKAGAPDVLRAVINVDIEKKLLIFAGTVPNGAVVTFSSSPGFEIIEYTRNKVNEFYEMNRETDVLILFSCMARHNALGPTISEEIDEAWKNWGKPLAGFFTYGEIGNNYNASCDFYNETFTMVSLKQKPDVT